MANSRHFNGHNYNAENPSESPFLVTTDQRQLGIFPFPVLFLSGNLLR